MINVMQALIFCAPQFLTLLRNSLPWRSADANQIGILHRLLRCSHDCIAKKAQQSRWAQIGKLSKKYVPCYLTLKASVATPYLRGDPATTSMAIDEETEATKSLP